MMANNTNTVICCSEFAIKRYKSALLPLQSSCSTPLLQVQLCSGTITHPYCLKSYVFSSPLPMILSMVAMSVLITLCCLSFCRGAAARACFNFFILSCSSESTSADQTRIDDNTYNDFRDYRFIRPYHQRS